MNKVTVVIPNYNGKEYIKACLESVLLSSTGADVIVVDNGSTDDSLELVKEGFKNVRLIELPDNTGFAHAVNVGIKASDTPYVFLLNNDTVIKNDTIAKLTRAMDQNPGAFAFQAKMLKLSDESIIDSAGDYYCALGWAFAYGKDKKADSYIEYTKRRRIFSACAGAAMYRRELLDKTGLFDEAHFAYLEDVDIGYRAKIYGYDSFLAPDAVVLHAGSASSGSRYNEFKIRLSARNSIYLIYKNMPFPQIILNLPFLVPGFLIKTVFFIKKGFGRVYIRGLINGVRLCFTKEAGLNRVRYDKKRLKNYRNIQIILWLNVLRRAAL